MIRKTPTPATQSPQRSANASEPAEALPELDPLMHQPLRTQIAAYLSGRGETTFSELKRVLGATDGNLDAHLGKLIEAGYVTAVKEPAGSAAAGAGRARTCYNLSELGRQALAAYVGHLSRLLDLAPRQGRSASEHQGPEGDVPGSLGASA